MPLRPETLDRLNALGTSEEQLFHALRQVFPHGHQEFLPQTVAEMELHSVKNHDYAAGGSPMGNFDRVANFLAMYPGLNLGDRRVLALIYALKQVDAVLWGLSQNIVHKVEGLNSRLDDISVYAKIVKCMNIDLEYEKQRLLKIAQEEKCAYDREMAKDMSPACGEIREVSLDEINKRGPVVGEDLIDGREIRLRDQGAVGAHHRAPYDAGGKNVGFNATKGRGRY